MHTVGVQFSIEIIKIKNQEYKLFLWDLGGVKDFRFLQSRLLKDTDGLLIIFDLYEGQYYSEVQEYLSFTRPYIGNDIPLIIVGNKKDLIDDDYIVEERKKIRKFAQDENGEYFEISAKTGENIETVFRNIIYKMVKSKNIMESVDLFDIKFKYEEEIIITEELLIKVHDLILEANNLFVQNEFEQAKIIVTQAENFAQKYRLRKGLNLIQNLKKKLNDAFI